MISEINRSEQNREDDIVVEDIELINIETSDTQYPVETPPSIDQLSISAMIEEIGQLNEVNSVNRGAMTENLQSSFQCLSGSSSLIRIVNKYLKNALISLLILISQLYFDLTALYGFITNSGCEDPTFRAMTELSNYSVFFLIRTQENSYKILIIQFLIITKLSMTKVSSFNHLFLSDSVILATP